MPLPRGASSRKVFGAFTPIQRFHMMKFGMLPFFLLAVLLIVGGGFVWLAFTDMPVYQQEMTVNVPVGQ